MRTPCRDEHRLPRLLIYPITLHPILIKQLLPQPCIQIKLLAVYRVVRVLALELPSQELPQLRRVLGAEEVPGSTAGAAVGRVGGEEHDVDRVGHVHVQTC